MRSINLRTGGRFRLGRNDTLSRRFLGPEIFAGQQYVCPAQRRDMRQTFGRHTKSFIPALCDCMAQMESVPVYDDCGEQVQPGDAVILALGGSVSDFTLAADTQRILDSMVSLAFVEADLGYAAACRCRGSTL